jgi:hypothetical protein
MNGNSIVCRTGIIDHGSRRGLLGCLSAGALGSLGHTFAMGGTEAREKGKKKGSKKRKKRCKPKLAPRNLAYECPGTPTSFPEDDGSVRIAQLFAASRGGTLREIQMLTDKEASSTGDYTLQLLRVIDGVPAHSPLDVLAATTIANTDVPDGESTLIGTFSGPELEGGTDYAVAIVRPGASGPRPGSRVGSGAACAGQVFSAQDLEEFEPAANSDLVLSVLVE